MGCNKNHLRERRIILTDEEIREKRKSLDFEVLEGAGRGRMLGNILLKAHEHVSSDGIVKQIRVRYKPKEVMAIFVDNEHIVDEGQEGMKAVRKTGWLVPGPGDALIYVPEEKFRVFLEIVSDERSNL